MTKITVQIQPGAGKNQVLRYQEGVWALKIAAPPVEGKANRELIQFLSDILDVRKSDITIASGLTGKRKVISIGGLTGSQIAAKLEEAVKQ